MMFFNCGHKQNKKLNLELINHPDTTGAFLHEFKWLKDHELGILPHQWNWIAYDKAAKANARQRSFSRLRNQQPVRRRSRTPGKKTATARTAAARTAVILIRRPL